MATYARGADSTMALTEVRTVLSRAETALAALEADKERDGQELTDWRDCAKVYAAQAAGESLPTFVYRCDPDTEDMIQAMHEVICRLDKYRRTGVTRRSRVR